MGAVAIKSSMAANLALVFAVVGWLLAAYGSVSQMGDPAPWVPQAEIKARDGYALACMLSGMLVLLASVWLSGHVFSVARWRAFTALALCVLPLLVLLVVMFISF